MLDDSQRDKEMERLAGIAAERSVEAAYKIGRHMEQNK